MYLTLQRALAKIIGPATVGLLRQSCKQLHLLFFKNNRFNMDLEVSGNRQRSVERIRLHHAHALYVQCVALE